jgi:hypothetical protein
VTRTEELIDALAERAAPVQRLRPPLVRAVLWLAFAGVLIALIAAGQGIRTDFIPHLRQPAFAVTIGAALTTGILSAAAAFAISIPGRSRTWLALPLPPLALWMSTIGYGCFADWVSLPGGFLFGDELKCVALLVMTSVPLAIALAAMLRYAAMLRTGAVALTGGLAIASITSAALPLFHDHDASALLLVWNLGTAALITGLAGLFGGRIFDWMAARLTAGSENVLTRS